VYILESLLNTLDVLLKLVNVAGEFLAESKWRSILSVSSTNLDNILEFVALSSEGILKPF